MLCLSCISKVELQFPLHCTLLCGRPIGRITRLARPSVCPSVCSVKNSHLCMLRLSLWISTDRL